jgi:hypothetical protein
MRLSKKTKGYFLAYFNGAKAVEVALYIRKHWKQYVQWSREQAEGR